MFVLLYWYYLIVEVKVTIKVEVTIPRNVREIMGIVPETDVEF